MRPLPPIEWFEKMLRLFGKEIGLPVDTESPAEGRFWYRYPNQSMREALYLIAIKHVSALNAAHLLLQNGFISEVGVMHRVLQETHEDIVFLALPLLGKERKELHDRFLRAFWQEPERYCTDGRLPRGKDLPPRQKIQSYISSVSIDGSFDANHNALSRHLSQQYSSYVHSVASHILELYDPNEARFRVDGYASHPLIRDNWQNLENHFFTGVLSIVFVARTTDNAKIQREADAMHARMIKIFYPNGDPGLA